MWIKACTGILKTSSRESSFISFNFKLQIKLQYNAHRNFETTFPVDLDEAGRLNALRKQNTDRNNNLTKVIAIFSRIGNQKEDLSFYLHIHFAKSKIDK